MNSDKLLDNVKDYVMYGSQSYEKTIEDIELIKEELQQYKAIEQELSIDLITLFKAFKNGVYAYDTVGFYKMKIVGYDNREKDCITLFRNKQWCGQSYKLKDYGTTWALTKGELKWKD